MGIKNCFREAGFEEVSSNYHDEDYDPFRDIEEAIFDRNLDELHLDDSCIYFPEYLSVDENLQCAPLPNTKASRTQQSGEANESDNDTGDLLTALTYQQAFLKIQSFLLRSYQSEEHYHLLTNWRLKLAATPVFRAQSLLSPLLLDVQHCVHTCVFIISEG
jgi:hypothetical protein